MSGATSTLLPVGLICSSDSGELSSEVFFLNGQTCLFLLLGSSLSREGGTVVLELAEKQFE